MKYMKMLEDIEIKDINDNIVKDTADKPVMLEFESFIIGRLTDPKFSADMNMVMSAFQIKEALKDIENGTLRLEPSDWENLVSVVRNPSPQAAYNPLYAINLVPFMREIVNAKDSKDTHDTAN